MKTQKLLAASLAVLISASAFAQTADEILAKHIAARGGADKLKGIQSIVTESSISTQFGEIPLTQTIVSGKGFRNEMNIMGNSMLLVLDGANGWMIAPAQMGGTGEPQDIPAEMVKGQGGTLTPGGPLLSYKEDGAKVELASNDKVNGKDAFHVVMTPTTGPKVDYWFDAASLMNVKTRVTAQANGQEVTQEMVFSDFKDVDGIKFPHTMETENPQAGAMTMTTNKITLNGKVDESVFKKPAK